MIGDRLARRRLGDVERRLVWIVGSPRTGTTWLLNLLAQEPGYVKVDEPLIGLHLGLFVHDAFGSPARQQAADRSVVAQVRTGDPDYFFCDEFASTWEPDLRRLLLRRFAAQLAKAGDPGATCLIKEPNGTQALPLLLRVLPKARVLWVLRDGRDVVDSELDGMSKGGWLSAYGAAWDMTPAERLRFVENRSWAWRWRTELTQAAFERLPDDQRLMVRYEELRADTPPHLARIHRWLGRDVGDEAVNAAAERLSFERLPAERRGKGKFARAAKPGGWRDNLSAEEQAVAGGVMDAKLAELGYA